MKTFMVQCLMITLFCSIAASTRNHTCKVGCMILWNTWCRCRTEVHCGLFKCYKIDEFISFSVHKKLKEYLKKGTARLMFIYFLKSTIHLPY